MISKISEMAWIDFQNENDIVYIYQGWQSESGIRFFQKYQKSGICNFSAGFGFRILFFSQHKYLNFKIFISYKNVC